MQFYYQRWGRGIYFSLIHWTICSRVFCSLKHQNIKHDYLPRSFILFTKCIQKANENKPCATTPHIHKNDGIASYSIAPKNVAPNLWYGQHWVPSLVLKASVICCISVNVNCQGTCTSKFNNVWYNVQWLTSWLEAIGSRITPIRFNYGGL